MVFQMKILELPGIYTISVKNSWRMDYTVYRMKNWSENAITTGDLDSRA